MQYSVRQFIDMAARELGITLAFEGEGVDERAVVVTVEGDKAPALQPGDVIVKVDPRYFRPTEVETLLGDPSNAKAKLGWVPQIALQEMVTEMVASDLTDARRHALLKSHGYATAVSSEH
ncbi:GDP-mannose 4,6-dehydratase [compost metagenome]